MMEAKQRSTILINIASILEKCEEQILPALYSRVGASFGATPTQLGNITLARSFMQALSSPLAGIAARFLPRGRIICLGCLIWSTFTVLFAFTSSLAWALPICAFNGIGLALVIPSVQSLTADYNAADSRGRAFGALWLTISFGGMLGALYATNVGATRPFGLDGWRFVFISVAVVSAFTGLLNDRLVYDPGHAAQQAQQRGWRAVPGNETSPEPRLGVALLKSTVADIASVLRIPTFTIIIVQGIIGSVPYASLVFLTLYLQLLGMSDAAASALVATYLLCGGLGGLLGGWVGDTVAKRWPNHGRVAATQFSVASGIPFAVLIFRGLPMDGSQATVALYAGVIALFSLCTAWPAPCANNPIFAEIVPVHLRNLVYSFDRCFEGAVAAFATPLVGQLSQRYFGFSGSSAVTGNPKIDLPNAEAIGSALLVFLVVPWALCLITYSGLHFTYPKDRRKEAIMEREKVLPASEIASSAGSSASSSAGNGSNGNGGRGSSLSMRQTSGAGYGGSAAERMPLADEA